jgi:hypothetical protein
MAIALMMFDVVLVDVSITNSARRNLFAACDPPSKKERHPRRVTTHRYYIDGANLENLYMV